jgi:hypothetical protein
VTGPKTRLLASTATAFGLVASGFDAHLAPQAEGLWHGVTGSPSPALIATALAAAALVWRLGGAIRVDPFLGMGVGLLPLLAATTGLGAPFLLFSRYTMVLVFAILLGWTASDLIRRVPRLGPTSVFLIAFSFFLLVGRFVPGPAGAQGDEPHYLLIAESLIRDGDVDLKNQFDERAFSKFTSADLEPHTAPRSPKDHLYAIHTPGLSALIAPGYALAGYAGARAMVSLTVAASVALLFIATRRLLDETAANFIFLVASFASPLPIYANSVFPDSVAVLPVAAVLSWLTVPSRGRLALAVAAIASLPWMHPRFLPLALVLSAAIAFRGGFSLARASLVFLPLAAAVALLLAHFQSLFGSASLSAAYGPSFSSDVSILRIPWGASALILDRQFGLLLFAPLLLAGVGGAAWAWTHDRTIATAAFLVIAVSLGVGGGFSMWWGGAAAPARFLIGAVPALLLLGATSFHRSPDRRALLGAAAGFGLGLLVLACLAPRALHNRPDGESGLLRLLAPTLDLDRFFPGFVTAVGFPPLAFLWAMVLVVLTVRPRVFGWASLIPLALASASSAKPLLDPFTAPLRVLESWNDRRRSFGGRDEEAAFRLDVPLGAAASDLTPGVKLYSPRFSLPMGRWRLRVESSAQTSPDASNLGRLSLVTDDESNAPLAATVLLSGENVSQAEFELPRAQSRVHVKAEGVQLRARILRVTLVRF